MTEPMTLEEAADEIISLVDEELASDSLPNTARLSKQVEKIIQAQRAEAARVERERIINLLKRWGLYTIPLAKELEKEVRPNE